MEMSFTRGAAPAETPVRSKETTPPAFTETEAPSSNVIFPSSVHTERVTDLTEFKGYLEEYCKTFDIDLNEVLNSPFTLVTPDSSNPYKQMYVEN